MTDQLTIFGKAFEVRPIDRGAELTAKCGLFEFFIDIDEGDDEEPVFADLRMLGSGIADASLVRNGPRTIESARDWLEAEARRIAREMMVMAGEVECNFSEDIHGATIEVKP